MRNTKSPRAPEPTNRLKPEIKPPNGRSRETRDQKNKNCTETSSRSITPRPHGPFKYLRDVVLSRPRAPSNIEREIRDARLYVRRRGQMAASEDRNDGQKFRNTLLIEAPFFYISVACKGTRPPTNLLASALAAAPLLCGGALAVSCL